MLTADKARQLYVKSYFATSIREAMHQACQELGPDALLLNTRETPPEACHLGRFEVIFGRPPQLPVNLPATEEVSNRVEGLRRQVDEIWERLNRAHPPSSNVRNSNVAVFEALVRAGLETDLARELEASVRQRLGKRAVLEMGKPRTTREWDPETLVHETLEEMHSRFSVSPEIGRVTALVGPPGCGKTTSLVKLAITQGLAVGRGVRLFSIDTQRIAAAEQLGTFAGILGVPFQAVETTVALAQAIDASPSNALLLIDTPGYSAAMLEDLGGDLASFLSGRQDIDTQLVLTASMRPVDLRDTAGRFAAFGPSKLLFTKLDETTSFAAIFCEAARQKKPLSFFCQGQAIPEDLESASKERVTQSLVRQLPEALRAVA